MTTDELSSGGNTPPLPRPHKSIFELLNDDQGTIQPAAQAYRLLLLLDTAAIVANTLRTLNHGSGEALKGLIGSCTAKLNELAPRL